MRHKRMKAALRFSGVPLLHAPLRLLFGSIRYGLSGIYAYFCMGCFERTTLFYENLTLY